VALRPVGDLPPSVYWVRRLMLLGVIVVIVAIVWWLWPNGEDGTESTAAEPTDSASVSDSPTATSSPSPTLTQSSQQPNQPTSPRCRDADIEVTVATSADTYTADQQPEITLTVENVSEEACSRDIGQAANELQVTSGGSQVWSSDDCSPGGEEELDNLKPGDRFVQTVTWARVQSSEGCPTPQDAAPAGTYQVIARNGDVLSEPAAFELA
jgi:cytoskeletal protein RodZ